MIKKEVVFLFRKILKISFINRYVSKLYRYLNVIYPYNGVKFSLEVNEHILERLHEIPSETTINERKFLYHFFRDIWSGKGNVVEIGPFLGGTTRAIGLGMISNPNLESGARLFTYDRFKNYYNMEKLKAYLMPLVSKAVIDKSIVECLSDSADFLDVFQKIHQSNDYSKLIVAINEGTPSKPTELVEQTPFMKLDKAMHVEAFFIDGCKSWYGTKYFMKEALSIARPGSYFIFQDYGWFTCFWLPSFINQFSEYFVPFCNVDYTHVFRLMKPLDTSIVENQFPDTAEAFGLEKFNALFKQSIDDALKIGAPNLATVLSMQHARALAHIGYKQEAKDILVGLEKKYWFADHTNMLKKALERTI